ncbi:hypothetical protein D9757_007677 [Collybiopsis confluens]|uniref:Uncharacterized protein n=1 Tax=Collybiopsis confluens TaxID=2823264 RepID=A0A8H5M3C1_9AGAR|nr:hypothetical protein D9757_007677 [Collybiopsis confluens]
MFARLFRRIVVVGHRRPLQHQQYGRRLNSTFPADKLLEALEMMAESSRTLPPVRPEFERESFWRAYLFSKQIIMYLAARPPTEAETFAAVSVTLL